MNVIMAQNFRSAAIGLVLTAAAAAGGCANDGGAGGLFSTGSLGEPVQTAAVSKPAADPMCVTLASQIATLRKDGTVERLEKAADGQGASVKVQRTALAKQTQLNKANADFIAKCGPALPKPAMTAAAAPAIAAPASPAVATAAKPVAAAVKPAVAKAAAPVAQDLGVTVAAPAAITPAVPAAPAAAPVQ